MSKAGTHTACISKGIRTGDLPENVLSCRYRATGNTASAVALLEAAVREHEQGLGLRHRGVTALTRRAEEWFEELPPSDRVGRPPAGEAAARLLLGCRGVLPVDKSGAGHLSGRRWHVAVTKRWSQACRWRPRGSSPTWCSGWWLHLSRSWRPPQAWACTAAGRSCGTQAAWHPCRCLCRMTRIVSTQLSSSGPCKL